MNRGALLRLFFLAMVAIVPQAAHSQGAAPQFGLPGFNPMADPQFRGVADGTFMSRRSQLFIPTERQLRELMIGSFGTNRTGPGADVVSTFDAQLPAILRAWQDSVARSPRPNTTPSEITAVPMIIRPQFLEVDAGAAGGTLLAGELPDSIRTDLTNPSEAARQSACSAAVHSLRANEYISNFEPVCMASSPTAHDQCAQTYAQYRLHCFSNEDASVDLAELRAVTGVVVRRTPLGHRSIICSGTVVGANTVATARHCLGPLNAGDTLLFRPAGEAADEWAVVESVSTPAISSTFLSVATAADDYRRGAPESNDDIILLRVDTGYDATARPVQQLADYAYQSVVLAGFQRLLVNGLRLQLEDQDPAVGVDDEALLSRGDWVKVFAFDATPTCRLLPGAQSPVFRPGRVVVDHFCQSMGGTSGGGVLRFPDAEDRPIEIVGVHVNGKKLPLLTPSGFVFRTRNEMVLFGSTDTAVIASVE